MDLIIFFNSGKKVYTIENLLYVHIQINKQIGSTIEWAFKLNLN